MFELVGVGFGPANLSLAVNMHENAHHNMVFLDRKSEFSWHPNMLTEGAQMQVSFLKDLASIRNPRSEFTFLNYLKHNDRLEHFANLREFYPSRQEFGDYLSWVADRMKRYARYSQSIVAIKPKKDAVGNVAHLAITSRNTQTGEEQEIAAKNLSIAIGGKVKMPNQIELDQLNYTFHSNEFIRSLQSNYPDKHKAYKFVVVGSGQSATEIFCHIAQHYPNATVTQCIRGYAIKPADETEFVNEIFSSASAELLYNLDDDIREKVLNRHRDTNYSAVDPALIKHVYRMLYEQRVSGEQRLQISNFIQLEKVEESESGNVGIFSNTNNAGQTHIEFDGMFIATGYSYDSHLELLETLRPYIEFDSKGNVEVDPNYRAITKSNFAPNIYLQGPNEHKHGLSDTLLSMMSIRADKIVSDLTANLLRGVG